MSILNHKNQFIFSGAIKSIAEVREIILNKNGENKIWRSRPFVIRNKFSKGGIWRIVDVPFEATGDAVDALDYLIPGQEVIVSWSFSASPKKGKQDEYWVRMRAWSIISPKDKVMDEKWWSHTNWQKVRGGEEYASPPPLSEEEKKRRRPATKAYNKDSFNIRADYSDKKEEEDDCPF